jgi:hypothetical protein
MDVIAFRFGGPKLEPLIYTTWPPAVFALFEPGPAGAITRESRTKNIQLRILTMMRAATYDYIDEQAVCHQRNQHDALTDPKQNNNKITLDEVESQA